MRRYLPYIAAAALLVLAGCSTYDSVTGRMIGAITPYRINIVQGNFVSSEAYSQLKPGMTRDQVRLLLGTPLLTDVFHANRWDYVFYFKRGNTSVVQERRLTVYFDGDQLTRWEGGENLPSEYELVREIDGQKSNAGGKPKEAAAGAPVPASAPQAAAVAATPADASPAATGNGIPEAAAPAAQSAPPQAADSSQAGTVPSQPVTSPGGLFTLPQ